MFNNRGVLRSVLSAETEIRLFRQCNLAASDSVIGAEGIFSMVSVNDELCLLTFLLDLISQIVK